MGIIVTPPEEICFSKNRIVWQFEDDKDGVVPGVRAENWLSLGGSVVAGTQAVFRWGDSELRFTASDTPDSSLAQFPTWEYNEDTKQAYVESLVPYFQNNYFLDEYFEISPHSVTIEGPNGSATFWLVKFLAKQTGSWYNFSRTTFNNGGIANAYPGTDDSTVVNNSVFVEVWIGDEDSTNFSRIHKAVLQFDENSQVFVDVSEILHSQLSSEIPDFIGRIAMKCRNSRRQYHLRYAQAGGQSLMIGKVEQTAPMVVVLGGFGEWSSDGLSVSARLRESVQGLDKLLLLRSRTRVIRQDEPVFVSWINFASTARNVHASAKITFADGTTELTNTNVVQGLGQYEKAMFGVGFRQLNMHFYYGVRDVREYTIQLRDDLGPVSEEYRMVVDYGYREFVRYFAFVNSWGAIDTLVTYGKASQEWKIFREQSEKFMPHVYTQAEGQFVEWKHQYQDNAEVASGWVTKKALSVFLDMFISPIKYRVVKGLPYPVAVNTESISRGTDGDNLHGVTFEYQFQRRFESVSEEELEGEDVADYIPANVVLAGSLTSLPSSSGGGGAGGSQPIRVDPYPVAGSDNAISSNAIYVLLQQKQDKIQWGNSLQYMRGDGKLMNMKMAVNAAESDPTVPAFAKTLRSVTDIVSALQNMPQESGLNVSLFGGQLPEWYIRRMTHPAFDRVPPIVVEKGKPFEKYLDLEKYKTSFHSIEELDVEIIFNTLKLEGVNITAEGLLLTLKGTLTEEMAENENVLAVIRDQFKNQGVVSLRIQTLEQPEEPENPDNRPVCTKGPFHYEKTAIAITNNGEFVCPFDAEGVNPVEWVICNTQDASSYLRTGQSPAINNTPFFKATFQPLPGGEYWVGIRGVLCKSNWAWRKLVLPVDTNLQFAADYPKHVSQGSDSKFLTKMTLSGSFLTEVLDLSTNIKVYSETHDYVANSTEIAILKTGGWPEANYRVSVGTASANVRVGNPPVTPSYVFKLVAGWDGATIADLSENDYSGPVPSTGFNGYFQADETAVVFRFYKWKLEKEVSGSLVVVTSAGGAAVTSAPSTIVPAIRLFQVPGVDSRSVMFQGASLNTKGKYRFTVELRTGTTEDSPIARTYQQTFQYNELKIYGGWGNSGAANGRIIPVVGGVKFNGVNVINNNAWTEPWASSGLGFRRMEFSLDKTTWYGTSAFFDGFGGATESSLQLLNTPTFSDVDLFPPGSKRTIYLRDGLNHAMISEPYVINQSGAVGGDMTAKSYARGWWEHIEMEKVNVDNGVLFTDLDDSPPDDGFIFWYMFNREIIKTPTRLVGYLYPKGKPWGVYKAMVQIGYTGTLAPWHGAEGSNESLARPFSQNCSIAFDLGVQNKK